MAQVVWIRQQPGVSSLTAGIRSSNANNGTTATSAIARTLDVGPSRSPICSAHRSILRRASAGGGENNGREGRTSVAKDEAINRPRMGDGMSQEDRKPEGRRAGVCVGQSGELVE